MDFAPIGAGLAAIAIIGPGLGIGILAGMSASAIGRNPDAAEQIRGLAVLLAAIPPAIAADNIEAEVKRLEALGAKRVANVETWVVMEAPTGQRFCVVRASNADFATRANAWPGSG